jgi:hypothetical protein
MQPTTFFPPAGFLSPNLRDMMEAPPVPKVELTPFTKSKTGEKIPIAPLATLPIPFDT